jgi:hypothetical protein
MKNSFFVFLLLISGFVFGSWLSNEIEGAESKLRDRKEIWGFFGHRKINRMAVFTLPPGLIGFYKKHIEYVTEHAVDPDKRRYATKYEAIRHYIDLDVWGEPPFPEAPRSWTDALLYHTRYHIVNKNGDTTPVSLSNDIFPQFKEGMNKEELRKVSDKQKRARQFFRNNILNQFYEEEWPVECDSFHQLLVDLELPLDECNSILAKEDFTEHGILPYNLQAFYSRLTRAFQKKDIKRILSLSADIGHYIGDAHVPLHTTENYNGQLTDQIGIHAFWESRIPELFADQEFDFFVGKAEYIDETQDYFWDIVLESHSLVDSVLQIEKRLSLEFPQDQQYCFEDRLNQTIRTQCRAYARAYDEAMRGMVEERMRDAVEALGNTWYSAWVDAGQPDLTREIVLLEEMIDEDLEQRYRSGEAKGREHGGE